MVKYIDYEEVLKGLDVRNRDKSTILYILYDFDGNLLFEEVTRAKFLGVFMDTESLEAKKTEILNSYGRGKTACFFTETQLVKHGTPVVISEDFSDWKRSFKY